MSTNDPFCSESELRIVDVDQCFPGLESSVSPVVIFRMSPPGGELILEVRPGVSEWEKSAITDLVSPDQRYGTASSPL